MNVILRKDIRIDRNNVVLLILLDQLYSINQILSNYNHQNEQSGQIKIMEKRERRTNYNSDPKKLRSKRSEVN